MINRSTDEYRRTNAILPRRDRAASFTRLLGVARSDELATPLDPFEQPICNGFVISKIRTVAFGQRVSNPFILRVNSHLHRSRCDLTFNPESGNCLVRDLSTFRAGDCPQRPFHDQGEFVRGIVEELTVPTIGDLALQSLDGEYVRFLSGEAAFQALTLYSLLERKDDRINSVLRLEGEECLGSRPP